MTTPTLPELPVGYPVLWREEVTATLYSHYPESERTSTRDCIIELEDGTPEDALYSELQALRDREIPVPEPENDLATAAPLPVRERATMPDGMRIVTVANHAGGVGKTSITLNVGYELAKLGLRVLLIDMDPQGSLTKWLGATDVQVEETVYGVMDKNTPLPQPREVWGLHLIPSVPELEFAASDKPWAILNVREHVSELRGRYDLVMFDCPPNVGRYFGSAAVASDSLIIPLPTSNKGVEAIDTLMGAVEGYRRFNPGLATSLIVPTMFGGQRKDDLEFQELYSALPYSDLKAPVASPVPDRPAIWRGSSKRRQPVTVFAPYSHVAKDVRLLTEEVARALSILLPNAVRPAPIVLARPPRSQK